ncbi:MAG: RHS repeat-associated core domain-containing protein [Acidobacteriota bacterium]
MVAQYDGASRLKQASGGTSSYGYDGDGRRVRVTDNGTAVAYVYSSVLGQSVLEANSTGVQRAYVYEGGRVIAQQSLDGQFYWLHTSHLGTARSMTDVNGTLVYKGQFDPYGQALSEWSATGNTNLNTKKFTGYERDAATGLDYANARMYNSHRGRFTRPDPKGLGSARRELPETLNRYAYANNDPVNHMDPTGEDWTDWIRFFAESACRDQGLGSVLSVGFLPGGQVSFLCSGGRALWEMPTKQLLETLGERITNSHTYARLKWSYTDAYSTRDNITLCGQEAAFLVSAGGQQLKFKGKEYSSITSISSDDPVVKEILGRSINRNSQEWGPVKGEYYDYQGFILTAEDIRRLKDRLSDGQEVVVTAKTIIEITAPESSETAVKIEVNAEAWFKFDGGKATCGASVLGDGARGNKPFWYNND